MLTDQEIANNNLTKSKIDRIPIILSDNIRNRLKVPNKYHSGNISIGVEKGFDIKLRLQDSVFAIPKIKLVWDNITIGNMKRISFGHAGSP